MSHLFYILMLTSSCGLISAEHCKNQLHSLATAQMIFVRCATMHSVPVELCIGCENNYTEIIVVYDAFRRDCSAEYFDKDRINLMSTMQSILIGLWTKAYCDDCYESNNFELFFAKNTTVDTCFNVHKTNPCIECLAAYQDLNQFYVNLTQHNKGEVCYDMQDQMNRTRAMWSKGFKCCQRSSDLMLFIVASCLVGVLPLLFYGGLFMNGLRRESNHATLDADIETTTPSAPEVASTSAINPDAAPPNNFKYKKTEFHDTDSDENDVDMA